MSMAQQSSPTSVVDGIRRPMSSKDLRKAVGKLLRGPQPLPIVQAGHPVLREVAQPYDGELSPELMADLVEAMKVSMHAAPGVGLAAPQIGLGLALAVVEDSGDDDDDPRERSDLPFRVIVNPSYSPVDASGAPVSVEEAERVVFEEGCLSVVGYEAEVARFRSVRVVGQDEAGRAFDEVFHGWSARIMQHEIDHLGGGLYIDKADLQSLTWTGRV
ncbi:peptide deformylase [Quadrisphaera granulorum]|uniref:Peptide deformylase n=2 Tax=Quadrisphaera granulorum TaxID=317664 RepID=A0A316A7P4_9ACTN|nr:peptide deformylase [Quadrisphaera granulorum]SZE96844.1 peptide deformylase [Quadrisphaera granulorum]